MTGDAPPTLDVGGEQQQADTARDRVEDDGGSQQQYVVGCAVRDGSTVALDPSSDSAVSHAIVGAATTSASVTLSQSPIAPCATVNLPRSSASSGSLLSSVHLSDTVATSSTHLNIEASNVGGMPGICQISQEV